MVDIFGKHFYIDLESVSDTCRINISVDDEGGMEINIFKYEIIKMCLERVLNEYEEIDEDMGLFSSKDTSVSFRLAFNTLIKNNILIEDENE